MDLELEKNVVVLGGILVGSGVLFDLFEMVKGFVEIAMKKPESSATPFLGYLVSVGGVALLWRMGLTGGLALRLAFSLLVLHIFVQMFARFLLRAPYNLFTGQKSGLFDPISYKVKKESVDTSWYDKQAKKRDQIIHGP